MSQKQISSVLPPQKLNVVLILVVQTLALGSLYLGSNVWSGWLGMLICAVVYSFVLQTNYALMHEAMHGILHKNSKVNALLGSLCSNLFPVPFSVIRVTHAMHHRHNRDSNERFDLYHGDHDRLKQTLNWYGIMTGVFWLLTVVSLNLIGIYPKILKKMKINRHSAHVFRALRIYFAQNSPLLPRLQILFILVYWAGAIWFLNLSLSMLALAAFAFAFNWSTRQYIQHAFADVNKISGSHNLKTNRVNGWILLNGQWDLVHHYCPTAPWIALSNIGKRLPEQPTLTYLKQYCRMWKGPMRLSDLEKMN